jgi:hypothetical protein
LSSARWYFALPLAIDRETPVTSEYSAAALHLALTKRGQSLLTRIRDRRNVSGSQREIDEDRQVLIPKA